MNNFKAIETRYAGHRFRSRLEARWAVFFDTLGIPWEYEKEGYELEGIRYLPDFWLPEQDCFIEIKGQEPTDNEKRKARLLSLYTQKNVSIFHGLLDIHDFPKLNSYHFQPPSVWKYKRSEQTIHKGIVVHRTTRVDIPPHILSLMQNLYEHELAVRVNRFKTIYVKANSTSELVENMDFIQEHLNKQMRGLQQFRLTIEAMKDEIQEVLFLGDEWEMDFLPQSEIGHEDDCTWVECTYCGAIKVTSLVRNTHHCNNEAPGMFLHNTPRLLAAYTAARSARFEFGEKGR